MKTILLNNRVTLIGKASEIRQQLMEYQQTYTTVQQLLNDTPSLFTRRLNKDKLEG